MDCLFCRIVKGELPSYTIYEDDLCKVILDKFPSTLGHALIIPKNHCTDIYDLDDRSAAHILVVAKKIAHAMKASLQIQGLNLLQNNGAVAGQTVFHYHMHLIPRFEGDAIRVGWDTVAPTEEQFTELIEKLSI